LLARTKYLGFHTFTADWLEVWCFKIAGGEEARLRPLFASGALAPT
jgi:hypothetical protein